MKKIAFNENKNIIHGRLKALREARGYTQEDLAAKMQLLNIAMDQQMISKIEHNARIVTDYELVSFCRILEVKEAELTQDYEELAQPL